MVGSETNIFIYPVHLRGAEAIAYKFGVNRRAVIEWYRQGAPISRDSRRYDAEYNTLQAWRVHNSREAEKSVN